MIRPGDIISYTEMTSIEKANLQRGMNFRLKGRETVILMSVRKGAPYADRVEENGRVLIYEGHDASKRDAREPKKVDQPDKTIKGSLTENGKFAETVNRYKAGKAKPELIRVYEKIRDGIWVYNGRFQLVDAWQEKSGSRKVFKFKLELLEKDDALTVEERQDLKHDRMIPSEVKLAVWKRDKGQCVKCQSKDNLHFDHDLPFSKGGTSLMVENIQLLCARHNLEKRDKFV